jgi:hypothetical protein
MSISMSEAKVGGNYNRNYKLPAGDYLTEVLNLRWKADGFNAPRFFLDGKIISPAPESGIPAGYEVAYSVCPDEARGGKGVTPAQAKAKDIGKIQVAVAACFGHPRSNASTVNQEAYEKAISQRPVSPLAGRLVVIKSVAYVGKNGPTSYLEVYPVSAWKGEIPAGFAPVELPETKPAPFEAKATPKAPPAAPSVRRSPSAPFPPHPWKVHPEDPNYFWNEEDDTQDPVHVDDLKKMLGR